MLNFSYTRTLLRYELKVLRFGVTGVLWTRIAGCFLVFVFCATDCGHSSALSCDLHDLTLGRTVSLSS